MMEGKIDTKKANALCYSMELITLKDAKEKDPYLLGRWRHISRTIKRLWYELLNLTKL